LSPFNLRGVVFDLDATLVDLGEHVRWRDAQTEILETYRACGCSEQDLVKSTSKGLFNFIHEMDTQLATRKPVQEMKLIRDSIWSVLNGYEGEGVDKCGFMPGTLKTLDWLMSNGVKMGVCTSNSYEVAIKVLKKLDVSPYFDSVVGRTVGMLMKPHPDQVIACFNEMSISPRNGVMIGDSHNDILAGKSAGAKTIAIPVYFTRKEAMEAAKPDAIVKSMKELPDALLSLR
jgi:phosphoglycolate phosphatase-like HAD superfamily hydrolase